MSQITRDAIIRIKLEQQRSKLEGAEISGVQRAYEQEKKAVEEVTKATKEAGVAKQELSRQSAISSKEMVGHFREGGEGALRFARGIAFLSASGSESLQKLVQSVSVAQGAFDVFAGGAKAFTHLTAVMGPAGAAAAGVTALLIAGAAAFKQYADEEARAAENARKFREEQEKALRVGDRMVVQLEREAGLRSELAGLAREEAGISATGDGRELLNQQRGFETALERELRTAEQREREARDLNRGLESTSRRGQHLPEVLEAERQQMSVMREQLDAAKERHRLEIQLLDEERDRARAAFGAGALTPQTVPFGGFAAAGMAAALGPDIQRIATERQQLIDEFTQYHRDMIATLRKQRMEIAEVERELGDLRLSATQ